MFQCHLAPEYRAAGHAAVLLDPFTAVRRGLLAAHAPELWYEMLIALIVVSDLRTMLWNVICIISDLRTMILYCIIHYSPRSRTAASACARTAAWCWPCTPPPRPAPASPPGTAPRAQGSTVSWQPPGTPAPSPPCTPPGGWSYTSSCPSAHRSQSLQVSSVSNDHSNLVFLHLSLHTVSCLVWQTSFTVASHLCTVSRRGSHWHFSFCSVLHSSLGSCISMSTHISWYIALCIRQDQDQEILISIN